MAPFDDEFTAEELTALRRKALVRRVIVIVVVIALVVTLVVPVIIRVVREPEEPSGIVAAHAPIASNRMAI